MWIRTNITPLLPILGVEKQGIEVSLSLRQKTTTFSKASVVKESKKLRNEVTKSRLGGDKSQKKRKGK